MAVFSIITTVNLIVECKSNYENASKMYKNLINLRQECLNLECENYIAFLKYNLLQMISPDYVINNSRDERLIYYYQLVSGEVFNAFRFIIRDLIDRIINNILKKIFGKTIQDALLKRKKLS
jgi:hypothetical protein